MSDLFTDTWSAGTPAVLVHGSLATGADEGLEPRRERETNGSR